MPFKFNPLSGALDLVNTSTGGGGGSGDVVGPASSTDNAIARYDSTTGKIIQNSSVTIDDTGNITPAGRLDFDNRNYSISAPPIRFTDHNLTDDESSKGNILEWGGMMQSGVSYPYGIATQAYKDNPAATFTVPTTGYKKWGWLLTHYDSPSSTGEDVHQHLNLETVKADWLTVVTRLQISFGEDIALVSFPNSNVKIFDTKLFQIGTDAAGLYIQHDTTLARIIFSTNTPWNITGTGGIRVGSTGAPGGRFHVERADDGIMFYAKNTAAGGTATAQHLIEAATSGSTSIATKVTGESINRFSMNHSGRMEWGSGAATRDVNLYRNAADELKTDDKLTIGVAGTTTGSAVTIDGTQTLTNKTLTTPTIASLTNATHNHTNAAGGGTLTSAAISNFVAAADTSQINRARRAFYAYDEFVNFVNQPFFLTTGTGTTGSLSPIDATSIGVGTLNTGAGATNRQGIWSNNVNVLYFSTSAVWTYETRMQVSALSDATDTYQVLAGFMDVATGESVDGAYFSYTHGTNAGKFETVTSSNSVRTRTDSGITVAASTWYVLKIVVQSVGGTLTAQFYINDVQVGGNVTTNIPNTSARLTGYGAHIIKSVGTNNRFLALDYMEISGYFGSNR